MQVAEPLTLTNCDCIMLVLLPDDLVGVVPMSCKITFHSKDPAQLAEWLRDKRSPTCPNDVALVDAVQAEIDSDG